MTLHFTQPSLFDPVQGSLPIAPTPPATDKQIAYATALAAQTGRRVPKALFKDRAGLSAWIKAAQPARPAGPFAAYPSAKQVQFAERIARLKRREIPAECFKDRALMSRWIDGNKPR